MALRIAIVGAGFSGTLTAVQLARQAGSALPLRVFLIDASGRWGQGVAYGTKCDRHLLNVPAGRMSAWPDAPDDFVRWAQQRQATLTAHTYASRALYGEYLAELLGRYGGRVVERVAARVQDIFPTSATGEMNVRLDSNTLITVDRVVLATGNNPPREPWPGASTLSPERYVRDPWVSNASDGLSADAPLLLVGTGLTMLDAVLDLEARGHHGPLVAVSRHGLLPQPHDPSPHADTVPPIPEVLQARRTALALLRAVRSTVRRSAERGVGWRDVIAALRPHTAPLWQSLPMAERSRFLRHVRPYWDVHRHRAPTEVVAAIAVLCATRRLRVVAGRIITARPDADGLVVSVQPRGQAHMDEWRVARVVNCTGPESDVQRYEEPLWKNLLARGWAEADPLGLGVRTASDGELWSNSPGGEGRVFVVGPMRKGDYWEHTAVPELRMAAAELAQRLLATHPSVEKPAECGEVPG